MHPAQRSNLNALGQLLVLTTMSDIKLPRVVILSLLHGTEAAALMLQPADLRQYSDDMAKALHSAQQLASQPVTADELSDCSMSASSNMYSAISFESMSKRVYLHADSFDMNLFERYCTTILMYSRALCCLFSHILPGKPDSYYNDDQEIQIRRPEC